jgi:hypothetical protein
MGNGDVVTDMFGHGGHGFSPDHRSLRAAFFIDGKDLAPHRAGHHRHAANRAYRGTAAGPRHAERNGCPITRGAMVLGLGYHSSFFAGSET